MLDHPWITGTAFPASGPDPFDTCTRSPSKTPQMSRAFIKPFISGAELDATCPPKGMKELEMKEQPMGRLPSQKLPAVRCQAPTPIEDLRKEDDAFEQQTAHHERKLQKLENKVERLRQQGESEKQEKAKAQDKLKQMYSHMSKTEPEDLELRKNSGDLHKDVKKKDERDIKGTRDEAADQLRDMRCPLDDLANHLNSKELRQPRMCLGQGIDKIKKQGSLFDAVDGMFKQHPATKTREQPQDMEPRLHEQDVDPGMKYPENSQTKGKRSKGGGHCSDDIRGPKEPRECELDLPVVQRLSRGEDLIVVAMIIVMMVITGCGWSGNHWWVVLLMVVILVGSSSFNVIPEAWRG